MFDLMWIASSSFLAALSGAVVPGPVFALVLSSSLKNGKISGPLIVLGHLLIEGIIILAIFMGFQQILQTDEIRRIIGYIGGTILVLMGLKLMLDVRKINFKDYFNSDGAIMSGRSLPYRLIFLGFLASGSNPHFFLWWLSIGLPIMINSISIAGLLGFVFFIAGHAAADLLWFSFISFSIHEGKRILSEKALKIILLGSSIFLICFAAYIILSVTYVS